MKDEFIKDGFDVYEYKLENQKNIKDFKRSIVVADSYLGNSYILSKIAKKEYFDFNIYLKRCLKYIKFDRGMRILSRSEARILYDSIKEAWKISSKSFYSLFNHFIDSEEIKKLYIRPWDCEYTPELQYSKDVLDFVEKVYPLFIKKLEEEFEDGII